MAGEAPVDEIEALAVPGIAWRSVLGLQQGRSPKLNAAVANAATARRLKYFIAKFLSAGR